ncbi:hypothetical protein M8C21_026162 [Ambrosia artemisiifolia]|uniref:Protein jagunal homolog 1-like n=1 Tax=Ambrosia artemisiifolia TaxID=4212 RepID=A0AAD5G9Q0_AMBAR|nr:hypothetical protein M8C21_026162 [Ambrosia artemisiifolia]
MQQRNSGNRRPTGTDGSDFSYRMVVDNRYTKVAKGKSTLSKVLFIQAVLVLVGVLDLVLTYLKKEPVETLAVVSSSITVISILVGELGRKRSRVNFLRFYMAASSIGILGSIASIIQSNIQLKASNSPLLINSNLNSFSLLGQINNPSSMVIHDPSKWETEKAALLKIACVSIGLFVQIFSITTTTSLISNMSPPKRAS